MSGVITEVAQGLGQINSSPQVTRKQTSPDTQPSQAVIEAKKQLSEVKASLQQATGMQGIFEGTKPLPGGGGTNSQHGPLRDKDPSDAGVDIGGLMKMTGGWSHLT